MVRGLFVGADILGAVDLVVCVLVTMLAPPLDHAAPLHAPRCRPDDTTASPLAERWLTRPMTGPASLASGSEVMIGRERVQLRRFDDLCQRHGLVGDMRALGKTGAEHDRGD